jgi:hypothetical protein
MRVALALLLLAAFVLLTRRLGEFFFLSIRNGRVYVVRGRVRSALLEAFSDISRDARIDRASLRAIWTSMGPRLVVRGVDEPTAQRLRNVFGIHLPPGPPTA